MLANITDQATGRGRNNPTPNNPTPVAVAYYTDEEFLNPIIAAKFRHISCAHVYAQTLRQSGAVTRIIITTKPARLTPTHCPE